MKNLAKSLAILTFASLACAAAVAQTLEVSGSTTVQERAFKNAGDKLKTVTGMDIKFLPVGSGKGLIALAEGKVTVSATSETLNDTVESAKKAAKDMDKTFTAPSNLVFHEISLDSIVVIVNSENTVTSLTKAQLKDLNTGKVKNWKEVGGPDLPVRVISSSPGSATRDVFQKQMMDGADYVAGFTEIRTTKEDTTKEEINEVSKEKGGIGAVSEAFFAANPGKSKIVKTPFIVRPLALITAGQPKPEVQKMIDYFKSAEGKKNMQ
jgi:phosphate transport system substrate-binding protein